MTLTGGACSTHYCLSVCTPVPTARGRENSDAARNGATIPAVQSTSIVFLNRASRRAWFTVLPNPTLGIKVPPLAAREVAGPGSPAVSGAQPYVGTADGHL
ncbi:hypothetical protein GCM10009608_23240 [Pseudonocardia alaniniphila]